MRGKANSEGIDEGGSFVLIPEGTYEVEITEVTDGYTKAGDPMINTKNVITTGEFKGKWVFDNIVIPGKDSGAFKIMGRTMHFLHVIGEPYEGEFVYNTDNWLYKKATITVYHQEYKGKDYPKIGDYDFADNDIPKEEVPF